MLESRRMRWAGHVARIWEKRNSYRILVGKPEEKEDLDIDGRITYKWILEEWGGVVWTGFIWLRIETSGEVL
jgi:hypothetical protein